MKMSKRSGGIMGCEDKTSSLLYLGLNFRIKSFTNSLVEQVSICGNEVPCS